MKFIYIVFLFVLIPQVNAQESAFDGIGEEPLTLQEEQDSETYIHQGMAAREAQELCKQNESKYEDICTEDKSAFDGGSMKTLEALFPVLTKAYAMFSAVGGTGKFDAGVMQDGKQVYSKSGAEDITVAEGKQPPEGYKKKTEKKPDYCGYIGMASEAVNTAYMIIQNQKTAENFEQEKGQSRQAASFYALAENHKDMAKASKVQFGVWGATAGCYVAYLAQAAYQGDWKVYAKLAAATFISTFYHKKYKAHQERERILKRMARELPQGGDCNPYTARTCFCNEESSFASDPENYRKYCVPEQLASRNQQNDAFICIDQNGKVDEKCQCDTTKTCIDRRLKVAGVKLGLGATELRDPLRALRPVSNGVGTAGVDDATNRILQVARNKLKRFKPDKVPRLSSNDKDLVRELKKNGIPELAGALVAKAKVPSGAATSLPTSATNSGLFAGGSPSQKSNKDSDYKSVNAPTEFRQGGKVRTKRGSSRGNVLSRLKRRSNKGGVIIVDDYEQKAIRQAEINFNEEDSLFDAITSRYQKSAWIEFKDQILSESNKK